jgi:hypothetical protein
MLKFIKSFFKKADAPVAPVAEYKVEAPSAPVAEVVPAPVTIAVEGAGAVEIPAKKAPAAKKPRAPKKPKAE